MKRTIIYSTPDDLDIFEVADFKKSGKTTKQQKEQMMLYDSIGVSSPKKGDVVNVKYVGTTNDHILFDGNFKDYIRVENKGIESRYLVNTEIGEYVDVSILDVNQRDYMILGGISSLYEKRAHESLKAIDIDESVSCYIRELTPAGYNVDIYYDTITLQGFMPNTLAGINRLYDPSSIVGTTIDAMIESFSNEEKTYIVNRRRYLKSLEPQAISELKQGVVYTGRVTGTTEFGVFIEFNEVLTGMVHKTNLDPNWVDRISDIPSGFEIEFYVKEIIKNKIILTQILRENLWDTIKIGQVFEGIVKNMKQFGALIAIESSDSLGLVHTSELQKTTRKVQIGDAVKVKVIAIDRDVRKIFLTLV